MTFEAGLIDRRRFSDEVIHASEGCGGRAQIRGFGLDDDRPVEASGSPVVDDRRPWDRRVERQRTVVRAAAVLVELYGDDAGEGPNVGPRTS